MRETGDEKEGVGLYVRLMDDVAVLIEDEDLEEVKLLVVLNARLPVVVYCRWH